MRGFGICLLVLCVIIAAFSALIIISGHGYDTGNGIAVFGSALIGTVLSGVLIALVDIRDAIRRLSVRRGE